MDVLELKEPQCEENEEAFKTTSGVRQGGCESPYCFNLYLDYILRIFEYECQHENLHITIPYRIPNEASDRSQRSEEKGFGVLSLLWLGYADDLAIITNSAVKLQTAMENLYNILTRFGLQMSLDKTRTMVMSDKYDETTYPETICTINNENLKNVETFTYLGQNFTYNEAYTPNCEIWTRKFSAINTYFKDELFYKNHAVSLVTRRKIFDSMFRSKLTYSCQTWSLPEASLNTFTATYNYYLRNLVRGGHKRKVPQSSDSTTTPQDTDMSYILNNQQIIQYSMATPLEEFVHNQQLKWFSHIVRSSNIRYIKKLTFSDVTRKRKGQPMKTLLRTVYKRLNDYEPSQILKACFRRKENSLISKG
ncbi:hypothetical protein AC249_AIPGENE10834 [Exaiptasia diaphana]|nr:hypothetical protein AC249_AIPGENE10834 [Exaiptasia diaphana]